MRSENELNVELAKPYSGPTFTRVGPGGKELTYIPWEKNMDILDEVAGGASGWGHHITSVAVNERTGVYVVAAEIEIYYRDEDGKVQSIPRSGVGRAVAGANKGDKPVTPDDHDLAAAAAESDALSRAAKKFGSRFGSGLIGGGKKGTASGGAANGGGTSASSDRPVSAKQLETIRKAGTPESVIAGLKNSAEASAVIDQIKANGWKYPGTGPTTPDDFEDDDDF